jgi:predicted negative regulator of RcsB-dependent stress response
VRALERGKRDEAIELATRSIEADPTDALPYLIKGSAFLEKGDMKSARAVFDACVTQAKKGAAYECAAMGGKKQR